MNEKGENGKGENDRKNSDLKETPISLGDLSNILIDGGVVEICWCFIRFL